MWKSVGKDLLEGILAVPDLDASKLVITKSTNEQPVPPAEKMQFGAVKTDHMLFVTFDPQNGWNAPEIKPYGPISLDPCASCFQYATNTFEGMKAYIGPKGEIRLFRPELNMERMGRSAERIALPPFNTDQLLTLIKKFVAHERRWIPTHPGYSLYLRPTMIGTRPSLGVHASDHALLYVVGSPSGPAFRGPTKDISLLAVKDHVRAWPGGVGSYKLSVNYGPGLAAVREASSKGYSQVLWLLGDKITEAGAMNFWVVIKRDDGDLDVYTPPLDGLILPGITRRSVIELIQAHNDGKSALPIIPASQKLHVHEEDITLTAVRSWFKQGKLLEAFCVGTAVIVGTVARIGQEGEEEILLDTSKAPVTNAILERLEAIQLGRFEFENWSVVVEP